jgi:hypothetical protein
MRLTCTLPVKSRARIDLRRDVYFSWPSSALNDFDRNYGVRLVEDVSVEICVYGVDMIMRQMFPDWTI